MKNLNGIVNTELKNRVEDVGFNDNINNIYRSVSYIYSEGKENNKTDLEISTEIKGYLNRAGLEYNDKRLRSFGKDNYEEELKVIETIGEYLVNFTGGRTNNYQGLKEGDIVYIEYLDGKDAGYEDKVVSLREQDFKISRGNHVEYNMPNYDKYQKVN